MATGRSPPGGDGERRADAAHRRRHLEHRGPAGADGGRRPGRAAERRRTRPYRQPGGARAMKFIDDAETAVLDAAKDMLRRGLVEGTAGNISARRADGTIVITPSSVDYR